MLHWKNEDFRISLEQAKQIKDQVEKNLHLVRGILVDNTEAGGTWPTKVNEIWGDLMQSIYREDLPCATLAASATNAMHVNRLSKDNDTQDLIKAFKPEERARALEFVSG